MSDRAEGRRAGDRAEGRRAGDRAGGRLFVVATPIGNLGDVTLRALEVLRSVPLVAAEDTRHTRRLLDRHGVSVRLVSFHARSGAGRLAELLEHLRGGTDLALVTDAGTPGVSDPGDDLVRAWAAEDGTVVPIPGPSAVLAAVAASGIAGPRWTFEGFLPRSGRQRRERLARIAADERGCILFEAPTRLAATLADLAAACGDGRPATVCRELTKVHETIERGMLVELAARAREGAIPSRGEIVLVVGAVADRGGPKAATTDTDEAAGIAGARLEVDRLVASGRSRADAARTVATATGIPRRALYRGSTARPDDEGARTVASDQRPTDGNIDR